MLHNHPDPTRSNLRIWCPSTAFPQRIGTKERPLPGKWAVSLKGGEKVEAERNKERTALRPVDEPEVAIKIKHRTGRAPNLLGGDQCSEIEVDRYCSFEVPNHDTHVL